MDSRKAFAKLFRASKTLQVPILPALTCCMCKLCRLMRAVLPLPFRQAGITYLLL